MERFIDLIKRRPLLILGAVVAVVLVVWYMGSGGSSQQGASVILSTGPSDATVQANAAVEIARLNAARDGNMSQQQAATYEKYFSTTKDIAEIESDKQKGLASIVTGATTAQTQIQANTMTELATIQKDKELSMADKTAALAQAQIKAAENLAVMQNTQKAAELQSKNNWAEYMMTFGMGAGIPTLFNGGPSTVVNANFTNSSLLGGPTSGNA